MSIRHFEVHGQPGRAACGAGERWSAPAISFAIRRERVDCVKCLASSFRDGGQLRCPGCDQTLSPAAFHKDKSKRTGRQKKCKECQYARYLERLAEDPEKVRRIARESAQRNRKRLLYGISNEEFAVMEVAQEGKCLLCLQVPPPRAGTTGGLVVDHNHATGEVRGLLCHGCNRGLGFLHEDPAILQRAITYLA